MSTATLGAPGLPFPHERPTRALDGPVLLATDGLGASDAPALAAHAIAARHGLRLAALAVLPPRPIYTAGYDIVPTLVPEHAAERRAELRADVTRRLEAVLGPGLDQALEIRDGDPARVIAETARACGAGLVVLGAGRHGLGDRLAGHEVALRVARLATMPVLAVAPEATGPIHRAVVGVDFGAASLRAARTALALLAPDHAAAGLLTLVHVRPVPEHMAPELAAWATAYDARVRLQFARVVELLQPFAPAGVTIDLRIRSGGLLDQLRREAALLGATLIAVGTHGPEGIARLFVAGIGARALRRCGRSVLIAPPPDAAERVRVELRVAGQVTLDRPQDWSAALDAVSRRDDGRRVRLAVGGRGLDGFVVEAEHYRFRGATYDAHDRRIALMLGDATDRCRHLTHEIGHVRSLAVVADEGRRDRALLIGDAAGDAALTFLD